MVGGGRVNPLISVLAEYFGRKAQIPMLEGATRPSVNGRDLLDMSNRNLSSAEAKTPAGNPSEMKKPSGKKPDTTLCVLLAFCARPHPQPQRTTLSAKTEFIMAASTAVAACGPSLPTVGARFGLLQHMPNEQPNPPIA